LDDYYSSGVYWHEHVTPSEEMHVHSQAQAKARVEWCSRWGTQIKSVTDVGSGYGWLIDALSESFGNTLETYYFVEPDELAAWATLQRSSKVVKTRAACLGECKQSQLIFFNQVLEHVVNPIKLVEDAFGQLERNGMLYIEVPNRDDTQKADVFPHMLFFTETALKALLTKCKFEVLAVESFGHNPVGKFWLMPYRLAYKIAIKVGWRRVAQFIDSKLWGYRANSSGIWLRAMARKP
jgi:SAM-dependent methyltransferase